MERINARMRLAVMAELRKAHATARDVSEYELPWIDYCAFVDRLRNVF